MTKGQHIVVTGGLGFIGSHLVDRLVQEDHEVTVFDNLSSGRLDNVKSLSVRDNLKLVKGDVRNQSEIGRALAGADSVVHLAGIVSVERSRNEPLLVFDVNVRGTVNVLEECRRRKVARMIFASSAAVYGDSQDLPLSEESPMNPCSSYASSKMAGEAYCKSYSKNFNIDAIPLRFMNIYGTRRAQGPYSGVMVKFAEAVTGDRPILINGDGTQTRDFTHVRDAVDAIVLCLRKKRIGDLAMNIGTGHSTSINDLASMFLRMSDKKNRIEYREKREDDILHSEVSVARAKSIIGYNAKVTLEEGVDEYYRWFAASKASRD